jgi:hypothetical protein
MMMPPLQGILNQENFFIYAACDRDYFDEFGPALINSVLKNTAFGVHLHLYNPTQDQIRYCRSIDRVSITYEVTPIELFDTAAKQWETVSTDPELADRRRRIITAMSKGKDTSIQQRIQRTYFASARFIRLQQLIRPTSRLLAIDIDAIVRSTMPELDSSRDFYIHYISGRKARYLAGGLYLTGNSNGYNFLTEYATVLKTNIVADNLYWGIDQDVLPDLVPRYHWSDLPMAYIDWEMQDHSYIWTAKGTRKDLAIFVNEKKKYTS